MLTFEKGSKQMYYHHLGVQLGEIRRLHSIVGESFLDETFRVFFSHCVSSALNKCLF
jgi:hypothetical protein